MFFFLSFCLLLFRCIVRTFPILRIQPFFCLLSSGVNSLGSAKITGFETSIGESSVSMPGRLIPMLVVVFLLLFVFAAASGSGKTKSWILSFNPSFSSRSRISAKTMAVLLSGCVFAFVAQCCCCFCRANRRNHVNVVRLPLLPEGTMEVGTFPKEVRMFPRKSAAPGANS